MPSSTLGDPAFWSTLSCHRTLIASAWVGRLRRVFDSAGADSFVFALATEDALHQLIRGGADVMPALFPVIRAALSSGAKGEA